jgi:hypothetical protein
MTDCSRTVVLTALLLSGAAGASAELQPEWIARLPMGTAIGAGLYGIAIDPDGTSYVTGIAGASWNTDVLTAAFAPDGSLLWSHAWDGPAQGLDQARGIGLGGDGHLYVTGNTPGPGSYANLLVLEYDPATGTLIDVIQLPAAPPLSEHGAAIAADAAGNVYVGGGTTGDGGDALVLSLDAAGELRWRQTWDGPAWGPYSQDSVQKLALDANGDLVVMIHGVMDSLQPDYVVHKYAPSGELLWEATWGDDGGDYAADLELDAGGDVFLTGTSVSEYGTIRLRGSDGGLLWQRFDAAGVSNAGVALALDGRGGVLVTGVVDPDIDRSNSNDDIYTVKRDATSGDLLWSHYYGAPCLYCYDAPSDVAADPAGGVFVAGSTSSPPYGGDAILLLLDAATGVEADRGVIGGDANEGVLPGMLDFDSVWNLYDGGAVVDYNSGEVQISVTKWTSLVEPLFRDGFEDGSTTAWSSAVP